MGSPPRDLGLRPDDPLLAERAAGSFGVYVHVPFCTHRCGYCDFAAFEGLDHLAARYVDAVIGEIRSRVGEEADTVFVGGGTPSTLGPRELERLLGAIPRKPDAEVTVEMNPETATPDVLEAALAGGANRISLGMQSAASHVLGWLERRHGPDMVAAAVGHARTAGFGNVGLDVIYGSPCESDADWLRTLDTALALEPEHISAYALTLEAGTPLGAAVAAGRLQAPEEDVQAARLALAVERLAGAGLVRYEISNWARSHPCRHNLLYWGLGRYVGVGSAAHSAGRGGRDVPAWRRSWNHRHPRTYMEAMRAHGSAEEDSETVRGEAALLEWLWLGLRRCAGLEITPEQEGRIPHRLLVEGLVELRGSATDRRLALTERGMALANGVVIELSLALGEC